MGEAASPLRASKDPTSSGLLQWRWPGTTVPMGAAPMRCIGAEGNRDTAFSTGWGVRTPPFPPQSPTSPICCCCLQEGDKAKQEAHDEPSKHKSISSPVTRVGYHQSLMLGGLHPPWRGSAAGSRREARRCWRGAGRGSPALQKHLGWVPALPTPRRGQTALPVLSGMGRCCASVQHRPCLQMLVRGRMRPAAFAALVPCTSRENFRLDWVPSFFLSCGRHLRRRVTCPRARGCPSCPRKLPGQPPLPKARPVPYHFSH